MAAALGAARRTLLRCSATSPALSAASRGSFHPIPSLLIPTSPRITRRMLASSISRLPVELSCVQSLMPFHSITASALLTSMLSVKPRSWAWLSEAVVLMILVVLAYATMPTC